MGVRWSQLDVQKGSGSALDMILNASFHRFPCLEEFFDPTFSVTSCSAFEDGDTVCYVGRVWNLPCPG